MTIAVRITNEDGERRRTVRVRQLEADGDGYSERADTQEVMPGESAVFFVHQHQILKVEEGGAALPKAAEAK